ncbi:MAG: rubrerythrin family protein [Muribaculaceae bacterium]|nr:rubrerythrin family protein [Muribaculaceae bacterium]
MATKSLTGTQTEKYLAKSFIVESTAYTRYIYFAKSAKKENYLFFAKIFEDTAANEKQHAETFLEYLQDGVVITEPVEVDPGILSPTVENLAVAEHEEDIEGVQTYQEAAKVAQAEGFPEIAVRFRIIAGVESHHKERFAIMRQQIENDTVWKREQPIRWQCMDCGFIFEGKQPPAKCPGCGHPMEHFMPLGELE